MIYNSFFNLIIVAQKFFLEEKIKFLIEESQKNNTYCIVIDFKQNDFSSLEKELKTINLFYFKKIIIVKNANLLFQQNIKEFSFLINYFKNPSYHIFFYFFSSHFDFNSEIIKILNNYFQITKIPFLYKKDFFSYVTKKLKTYNLSFQKEIIMKLIDKTNYNLFYLEEEINKIRLLSYSKDNELTTQTLENLIFSNLEYYIFKLINYFLNDDIKAAYEMFKYLKQRNDNDTVYIINNICTRLKKIIMIKCLQIKKKNVNDISNILNISFVKVNFLVKEASLLSFEKIKKLFLSFLELKYLIKRNLIDAEIGFEILIMNCGLYNVFNKKKLTI